jgi:hypothetical protein
LGQRKDHHEQQLSTLVEAALVPHL